MSLSDGMPSNDLTSPHEVRPDMTYEADWAIKTNYLLTPPVEVEWILDVAENMGVGDELAGMLKQRQQNLVRI